MSIRKKKKVLFYRNSVEVISDQGDEIDATSLWKEIEPGLLLLVDDDLHATITLDTNFEAA